MPHSHLNKVVSAARCTGVLLYTVSVGLVYAGKVLFLALPPQLPREGGTRETKSAGKRGRRGSASRLTSCFYSSPLAASSLPFLPSSTFCANKKKVFFLLLLSQTPPPQSLLPLRRRAGGRREGLPLLV